MRVLIGMIIFTYLVELAEAYRKVADTIDNLAYRLLNWIGSKVGDNECTTF